MFVIKILYFLLFIITINCSGNKVSNYHGVKLLDAKFDEIKLNITNKNDLYKIIGPPSFKSEFNENKWFYVERLKTNQSLFKFGQQKIKKNNVLIVEISNEGLLINKKILNLNNMNDVKYLKTQTNKEFQNKSVLYDVFSSLREKINAPIRSKK
tara:strand:+ start:425 stop:886 length:462 start_codon:yes stop_codon:yes gene_type:complete